MQPYIRDAVPGDVPAIAAILADADRGDGRRRYERARVAAPERARVPIGARVPVASGETVPPGDAAEAARVAARQARIAAFRDALSEIDRTEGNYVLVAEYDQQITAFAQLVVFRRLDQRGRREAELVALHVAEPFRTTGVAGMLVDHVAERARELGCPRLRVSSGATRTDEHVMWERLGFVPLERGYVRSLR